MLLFQQMLVLFVYMMIGYVACKKGKIDKEFGKKISWMVLNIASPMLIVSSALNGDGTIKGSELAFTAVIALGMSLAMMLIAIVIPKIFRVKKEEIGYFKLMTVFNNIAFMGFPIISAAYGDGPLLYGAVFLLPYNIFLYTYGMNVASETKQKFEWKNMINAGVVASICSMIFYLTQMPVPQFVKGVAQGLGTLPAPLSMIVIGISLTELDIKKMFLDVQMLLFALTKLIVLPILGMLVLKQFVSNVELLAVCMVMLATPAGSMTAMIAQQQGGNYKRVAQGVALTTLLSVVTIPLVMMIVM